MLRLERVSKFYSGNGMVSTGFSKVDLKFEIGEFVAITGESGSGKSTLLNVISGLDSYEEGEMYILGNPTSGYSKEDLEEYRKQYIGSIFQTFNLINSYTVYQNVELVLLLSGYDKKDISARVHDIIAKVGLEGYEKTKASKLSGGQKQRVAIARALAKETPIIVADEPTGNLDVKSAGEIIQLLHELSKDKLIIIVTHNYEQVEPYITRKITLHDGRVVEDKRFEEEPVQVKKEDVVVAKDDPLKFFSMVRLGLRNTFNIPAKFLLLLVVFIFLCTGTIFNYASVLNQSDASFYGWNDLFSYTGKDRILITKPDSTPFTEEDYTLISSMENVREIVENDLTLDVMASVVDESESGYFYINAAFKSSMDYEGRLVEGRMPETSAEAVLMLPEEGYVANVIEDAMNKEAHIYDWYHGNSLFKEPVTIVGYGYLSEDESTELEEVSTNYLEAYLCMNQDALDSLRMTSLERYCTQEIYFAEQYVDGNSAQGMYTLRPSEKVAEGKAYIPEELSWLSSTWSIGKELQLTNKSLYFEDTFDFTVGAVYTKETLTYYLGLETKEFDSVSGSIFLNPTDYAKIFDKENYQSSVMTMDEKLTHNTAEALEAAGYKAFVVNDAVVSYESEEFAVITKTMSGLLLAGVLVVLFFVTYFITKLILKSRNVYFSTIRMLGASKANCSNLLKVELFVVLNIAYILSAGMAWLLKQQIIYDDLIEDLCEVMDFLETGDFVLLYVVLCIMSILLAARFSQQLFKKTAMNAYKEEV